MVPLDISKTGFQIDRAALAAAITPKTKAILLNSPHNPTGTVLNEASLGAVKEAVLGKPIFVIWCLVLWIAALPCSFFCLSFGKLWKKASKAFPLYP